MIRDNSWIFDDEAYEKVKKEISDWPEWKKEYYEEAYIGVGKAYYDESYIYELK